MHDLMKKLVRWLDPKLERFRGEDAEAPAELVDAEVAEGAEPEKAPVTYSPESLEDFLQVIKNTPMSVLSAADRATIASAISFRERKIESIMLPREKITFVYEHDFLGPLMLDRLYKSGYSHFPVLSSDGRRVIGILHTAQLNSLEVKNTERASTYVDPKVFYLRGDYTLEQAMAAFLRTNSFFYMVVNAQGQIIGLLTYKMLVTQLLGYEPSDEFSDDSDLALVSRR